MSERPPPRKILRYKLRVKGLFGRNRTIKTESITLTEREPKNPATLDELTPIFRAKLAEIKFKGGHVAIWEDPLEIEEYPSESDPNKTVSIERYMLMSGRQLHSEKIEGGGVRFGS